MIPRLKALKNRIMDGQADALTLMPQTLYEIIDELENMCVTTDSIEAKPRDNGRPGFWLNLRGSASTNSYTMGSQNTSSDPDNDTWSRAGGATTNGTDPVVGDFDGVKFDPVRVVETLDPASPFTYYDSNGDSSLFNRYNVVVYARRLTFSNSGMLIAVSAESAAGSFSHAKPDTL